MASKAPSFNQWLDHARTGIAQTASLLADAQRQGDPQRVELFKDALEFYSAAVERGQNLQAGNPTLSEEAVIDEQVKESFPASDPPGNY